MARCARAARTSRPWQSARSGAPRPVDVTEDLAVKRLEMGDPVVTAQRTHPQLDQSRGHSIVLTPSKLGRIAHTEAIAKDGRAGVDVRVGRHAASSSRSRVLRGLWRCRRLQLRPLTRGRLLGDATELVVAQLTRGPTIKRLSNLTARLGILQAHRSDDLGKHSLTWGHISILRAHPRRDGARRPLATLTAQVAIYANPACSAYSLCVMVPDDALSLSEIARRLRVNPATVRLCVSQGRLPAYKAGASTRSRWWVKPEDLEAMLEQRGSPRTSRSWDVAETDYRPGPDEPGLGMFASLDLGK